MKKSNNYFKSILGGVLGALLFGIPWVLVYVYGGYILSILALLIAFGAFKFYKLFGGIVTKKTGLIITIISILTLTFLTLVVIPNMLLLKDGYLINLSNFKILYNSKDFISSLMRDYVISLVFTGLGISGIIANINKEAYIKNIKTEEEYLDNKDSDEQIKKIRKIYEKYNAINKENAIPNSVLFSEMNAINKNLLLNKIINDGLIVKYKGRTYFDIEADEDIDKQIINAKRNKKRKLISTILLSFIFIFFAIIIGLVSGEENNDLNVNFNKINIILPNTYTFSSDGSSENLYTYYSNNESNIIDIIALLKEDYIDDYKDSYVIMLEEDYDVTKVEDTDNGFKVQYTSDNNYYFVDYVYYINDEVYAVIFATNENNDLNEFLTETEKIVKTFNSKKIGESI